VDWKLEARIRERAYQIWEREGRPEGRDFDHWTRAVAEVSAEEGGDKGPAPAKKAAAAKPKAVNGSGKAAPKVAAGAIKAASAKKAKPKGKPGASAR
jgi:hypothetical protein